MDFLWLLHRIRFRYHRIKTQAFYKPFFKHIGPGSMIMKPIVLRNSKCISIGARCSFREGARIEVIQQGSRVPSLTIGDDSTAEQGLHLVCSSRVTIGNCVTFAPRVTIVDTNHPYEDVSDPSSIGARLEDTDSFVEIKDQAFLGTNVVVLPNVVIGKYCIVGANSVVSKSLPDYTVCAGSPARPIKQYDHEAKKWVNVPR